MEFLLWDESKINLMLADDYESAEMRKNGATAQIYPSNIHNRFAYQVSIMVSALADALSAQGYTVDDDSKTNLTDVLARIATQDNLNSFTVNQQLRGKDLLLRFKDISTDGSEWGIASDHGSFVFCLNTGSEEIPIWDQVAAIDPSGGMGAVPGSIILWPGETPADRYLECNGSQVSRTTYSTLYSVIGITYGRGDSMTTFNLPDLRGRFPRGWDHGAGNDPDAAIRTDRGDGTTGDYVGTTQADEIKSHRHGVYALQGSATAPEGWYTLSNALTDNSDFTGGNETRPKNINMMYCIKY